MLSTELRVYIKQEKERKRERENRRDRKSVV